MGSNKPGVGGYTYGEIGFTKDDVFFIYIGKVGAVSAISQSAAGGWNGGGYAGGHVQCYTTGGGGATDIRINKASTTNTVWNNTESLLTRIMVAAGGGGTGWYSQYTIYGGNGGGINGSQGYGNYSSYTAISGATQTSSATSSSSYSQGSFGFASQTTEVDSYGGGGGGGWWGGTKGYGTGGSGGSSFISGMTSCVAINSNGKQTNGITTMTINDVSYIFDNPQMKVGTARPSNPGGTNGYCRITGTSATP